jgi:hypothetical protein
MKHRPLNRPSVPKSPPPEQDEMEALLRRYYRAIPMASPSVDAWIAAAQYARRPRPRGPWAVTAVAATGVVALLAGGLRLAPRAQAVAWAATQGTPLQQIVAWIADPGLQPLAATGQLPAMDLTARHDGETVQVLGAYADTVRTVVFLQTTGGIPDLQGVTLQDQFGHQLVVNSLAWHQHQGVLEFSALPAWVWTPGVRLTLRIPALTTPAGQVLAQGPWQFTWDQPAPTVNPPVSVNVSDTRGGVTFTLDAYSRAPSATALTLSVAGARVAPPTVHKGAAEIVVQHVGGDTVPLLSVAGGLQHLTILTAPLPRGRYILRITTWAQATGPWLLPFTVSPTP